ncbi:MAG: helix-turn-helix transcriptional regulator [Streptosporangiaceae bacterium]|nr:helix-turn-helix transcriptional regulator [Streptosporangiaceae bacterium]
MSDDMTPGDRLRMFRDAAGKSRPQLAGLMGCSAETVKAIEAGRRELTLSMAVRAARALGIRDLAALYGPGVSYTVVERPTHAAAPEVSRALLVHRIDDDEPQTDAYLRAALDSAWQVWHTSSKQRTETGKVLPRLILDARRAATRHEGGDRREVHRLLAQTYHLAQAWLAWHGDRELVWMSADRAYSAAQAADDPLVMARACWYYAALLRATGHYADAVLELDSAIPLIRDRMEEDRESAATYVDLEMHAALTLARAGDESAWARWEKGRAAAHRLLPEGYAYPQTRIGQVMVELYGVMVAVALGHGDEARRRAASIDPASIPSTEQRAKHLIELARGYQFLGEELGVVHLLGQAADVSTETVIYSPPARALTRDLLRKAPPANREDVQRLASRIGIQD